MPIYRTVVETRGPMLGGVGVNTWHFRTPGSPTTDQTALTAALAALQTFYGSYITNIAPSGVTVSSPGLWIELAEEPTSVQLTPWSTASTGSNTTLPSPVALVVGWRTALAARSGRGRTFINPVRSTLVEANGTPTTSAVTSLASAGLALINDFDAPADGSFVVWSPTDGVGRDYVNVAVQDKFAVLRSRRD